MKYDVVRFRTGSLYFNPGGVSERDFEIGRAFYFRSLRLQP